MTIALSDLLQPMTQQQAFQLVLSEYQGEGFPVQSWQTGGVERTRAMAIATGLASLSNYIPAVAGGGLLDYSPNFPGWTALTADQFYDLQQNAAAFTYGNVLATNTSSQAYTFTAGNFIVVFGATLNRYKSVGGGTIPAGGSLSIPVVAEFAGALYSDPSNSGSITLVTPLAGVTITNPASNFTDVTHTGSGTGTLTLGGSPTGPHSILINVAATTAGGTSPTVSYFLDSVASTIAAINGVGITIAYVAGASGTSWVLNDAYAFNTPGSWITSQGADVETDIALAQRCRNRWSSLSNIQTTGYYELLCTSTPSVGSQVTQTKVVPDATINNKVNIIVAGPGGVLPGAVITALQAYISPRSIGGDSPVVQSPTTLAITIAGTVTCSASLLAAAQVAIQTGITTLVNGIGINGTLRLADIIQVIMDIDGVIDISGVTINAVASNLTLGSSVAFVLASLQPLSIAYVTQ